ncbi:MAG: hypothetical protein A3G23_01785 [Bacteroidetes bacterium RIFCSPLOWO2_12_FULL_37_12]|nr:MAG: hypothetical protein A3G23_01785 [Bacteroidetes bacterium RIFCSPLOWO2_12_FULL_37_12]
MFDIYNLSVFRIRHLLSIGFLYSLLLNNSALSQGNSLSFEKKIYDFGNISEGEIVNHHFHYINPTTKPVKISFVRSSCGCTTPAWSKEPIAPGDTGSVYVEFNSAGRTGRINKIILVVLEKSYERISLTLTGFVQGKNEPAISFIPETIKTDPGDLKNKKPVLITHNTNDLINSRSSTEDDTIRLGKIEKGQSILYFYSVQNQEKKTMKIKEINTSSDAINVYIGEQNINPGKNAELKIEVDGNNKIHEWNYLVIKTNDTGKKEKKIWIHAQWVETMEEQSMMRIGE